MDAAVRTHQQQQESKDSDGESVGSLESIAGEKTDHKAEKPGKEKKRKSKSSSQKEKEKAVQERIEQYQEGKQNLPPHEVIQNSFHFKTTRVDLQLCDDTTDSGGVTDTVQGSMLIQASAECILQEHAT